MDTLETREAGSSHQLLVSSELFTDPSKSANSYWELWFCMRLINLNSSLQSLHKVEQFLTSVKRTRGGKQPPVLQYNAVT